jgi:hypothetical protein
MEEGSGDVKEDLEEGNEGKALSEHGLNVPSVSAAHRSHKKRHRSKLSRKEIFS